MSIPTGKDVSVMARKDPDLRFLLYSINYAPELTGIGKYNGEMAEWLVKSGSKVDVICAPPHYPEWKVHKGYSKYFYSRKKVNGVTVTRCPAYIPAHPHVIKRLIHLISFALTSSLSLFGKLFQRPDVVFVVQPTLFCVPMALLFSKLVGAKSVLHIQDFEIDAMFGLGMANSSRLSLKQRIAKKIEKYLMRRFDMVSSISHSMLSKAEGKGVPKERIHYFPNWSDTEFVNPTVSGKALREAWGVSENQQMVLYAGNLGAKQGLGIVLDVAERMLERDDLRFFIVGSGAHEEQLKQLADYRKLSNLEFKALLPWGEVPQMLAAADVHLVVQRKGAADAVMPSKLTNILSAGGYAVVTAEEATELGEIAARFPGVYRCVKPESLDALASGLEEQLLAAASEPYNRCARDYALTKIKRDPILLGFRDALCAKLFGGESEHEPKVISANKVAE